MPSISNSTQDDRVGSGLRERAAAQESLPPMTRDKRFGWLLVITGIVGWLASGALVLEKLEVLKDPNHVTACDINPWVS